MDKLSLLTLALTIVPGLAIAGDAEMKPGKWETKITTTIEGVPVPPQTVTQSQCLTDADVKDKRKLVPNNPQDAECKIEDFKVAGSKVTWKVACPKTKTTGSGEMSIEPESYSGKIVMTMENPGQKMKVSMGMVGKRVGACK